MKSRKLLALALTAVITAASCISVCADTTKLTFGYPTGWEYTEQTSGYTFYQPDSSGIIYVYNTDEPDFDVMSADAQQLDEYMHYTNPRTSLSAAAAQFNVSEVAFSIADTYTEIRNSTLYRVVDMPGQTGGGSALYILSYMCTANGSVYHFDLITDKKEAGVSALKDILDSAMFSGDVVPESDLDADKINISININGRRIRPDSPPELISGRTLVPIRAVAENLGYKVDWDAETRTVAMTSGDNKIDVKIDADSITKNGGKIPVDVPAQIIDSRTYLPLRAVAEAMDCRVEWDGENKTVDIYS